MSSSPSIRSGELRVRPTELARLALLLTLSACGADFGLTTDVGPGISDAGPDDIPDATRGDGATPASDSGPPSVGVGIAADSEATSSFDDARACYASCGAGCDDVASCCVGSGAASCCAPEESTEIDLTSCRTRESCGFSSLFGDFEPSPFDAGWVVGGSLDGDGGAVLGEPVDLRNRSLELRFTLVPPSPCPSCLDVLSIGVVPQAPTPTTRVVRPQIALRYAPGLPSQQVQLDVGDRVVARFDAGSEELSTWTLELSPTGDVIVTPPTGIARTFANLWDPGVVVPVVFGRSENPGDLVPTQIATVSVATSLCDIPDGWRDARPLDLGAPATSASWVTLPDRDVVVFMESGQLRARERAIGGPFLPTAPFTVRPFRGGVSQPELVQTPDGWHVYATIELPTGTSIWRAVGATDLVPEDEPLLTAEGCGCDRLDSPTVAIAPGGEHVLVVREIRGETATLAVWQLTPTMRRLESTIADLVTDAGEPSLVVHHGTWQLYVGARRGTRRTTRAFVSDELIAWRDLGEVFQGSGVLRAFDGLGAEGLDVASRGDALFGIYVGSDGVDRAWGEVRRDAPFATR